MKKNVLFTWLLLTLFAKGQSTTYYPFPERNATWNFSYLSINMSGPEDYFESYSISFSGDTIINNLTYHKLTTPLTHFLGLCGYKGAIRQDIAAKKVFIVPPSQTSEELLYDFTLQVGDTVKGYISQNDTVESIDTILVGSTFRKIWRINHEYRIDIIEGIGSTYGLLQRSPGNGADFPYFGLNCFKENNQTLFPDSQTTCEVINSENSIETNRNQIGIIPNSGNGSFIIEFYNSDILEIKLIDLYGKVFAHQSTKNERTIEVDNLQVGLYILIGRDTNNRTITKKLISSP
jgi:hypothetical protein